ncbi:MBL fold metallo-hydrolase [candidate division CSSED10-310 bacterium]|uniref:MBL fold metallo-hydrolase n=1 Tax=candidate division CSSED10-310 bacterium TaxID=2855610 RepID=A0ABV6Z1V7_UNCC1
MKITALGVNSAFATGCYQAAITVEKIHDIIKTVTAKNQSNNVAADLLKAEIAKASERVYIPKWHSNFLIEFDTIGKRVEKPYRLLVDAGADVRHSLQGVGLTSADLDGIYISHPHHDHIGGIEYIGITTLFNPDFTPAKNEWLGGQFIVDKLLLDHISWPQPPANAKPDLFIHRKVLESLKRAVGPGLDTVQGIPDVCLETYFDIHLIGKQEDGETKVKKFDDGPGSWTMKPLFAMHVLSSSEEMASYGISFEYSDGYTVVMPTDTQHMMPPQLVTHYRRAQRIYMDCETAVTPTGVHPHISDLIHRMSPDIQKKCLLYHYETTPDIPENMFYGILKAGDSHTYPV